MVVAVVSYITSAVVHKLAYKIKLHVLLYDAAEFDNATCCEAWPACYVVLLSLSQESLENTKRRQT